MFPRTCVGIELTRHLRLAVLGGRAGKYIVRKTFEILDFVDLREVEQRERMTALVKEHAVPAGHVFLALQSSLGILRQVELPVEARSNVRSIIELQLESLAPWPAADVYWECNFTNPAKESKSILVNVSIVPREIVDRWTSLFRAAGLPLSGCLLAPMALSNGVRTLYAGQPVLVLGCDGEEVDATLVHGERLIHQTLKAESLDSSAEAALRTLPGLMRVSLEKFAVIGHGTQSATILPGAPVVFPPPRNFQTAIVKALGAITAALAGFKGRGFANLLPSALQHRTNPLRLVPTYGLAAILILVGLGFLVRNTYQTYVYSNRIEVATAQMSPAVKEVSQQEAALNTLIEKERSLQAHVAADRNLEILAELTDVLPAGTWLTAYTFQGNTISLSGYSDRASEVQKTLEDSRFLKDVQFSSPITRDASRDRFAIRAAIEEVQ